MPVAPSNCTERYRLISRLCARQAVSETVTTRVRLPISPEAVWRHIMFYEEVPTPPGYLLRLSLPYPIRTDGSEECGWGAGPLCVSRRRSRQAHHDDRCTTPAGV